ncbi:MAG TPA: hypothetical protein VKB96_12200, partial [Gammaproteobacteria bacterium]|nr:hypothetical protein [Gammaproteobacteria bacterium]
CSARRSQVAGALCLAVQRAKGAFPPHPAQSTTAMEVANCWRSFAACPGREPRTGSHDQCWWSLHLAEGDHRRQQ